jgi:hypothetical protein
MEPKITKIAIIIKPPVPQPNSIDPVRARAVADVGGILVYPHTSLTRLASHKNTKPNITQIKKIQHHSVEHIGGKFIDFISHSL